MRTTDDVELVRRAAAGEHAAYARLVERYRADAYRVALRVVGRHEDAEDVTQESLLTAFRCLDKCGRPERFGGWLMTIVRNLSLNLLRNEAVRETDELHPRIACGRTVQPDRAIEDSELRRSLQEELRALPEPRRRVFLMREVEGYQHAEIADTLGLRPGTVRSHLWHAKDALRTALASRGYSA